MDVPLAFRVPLPLFNRSLRSPCSAVLGVALAALASSGAAWAGPEWLDFDRNGVGDVLTAAVREELPGLGPTGVVSLLLGGAQGPGSGGVRTFQPGKGPLAGWGEPRLDFGAALAVGDFNGDQWMDFVASAPGRTVGGHAQSGEIVVFMNDHGSFPIASPWNMATLALPNPPEYGARFGQALAAADLNQDGFDDLVIGAPGVSFLWGSSGSFRNAAGAIVVLHGSTGGLKPIPGANGVFHQEPEPLATAGFGSFVTPLPSWQPLHLAVGAPNAPVDGVLGAGVVQLMRTVPATGVTTTGALVLSQNTPGILDAVERDDHFGAVIVDGCDWLFGEVLLIAVPSENRGTGAAGMDSGVVHVVTVVGGQVTKDQLVVVPRAVALASAYFGAALALDCERAFEALYVGEPLGEVQRRRSGLVHVFTRTNPAQNFVLRQQLSLETPGVPGNAVSGGAFGSGLGLFLERLGVPRLLVSSPGEPVGAASSAGALYDFPLDSWGWALGPGSRRLRQKGAGGPEHGDNFSNPVIGSGPP
jgi:hypothetical protein